MLIHALRAKTVATPTMPRRGHPVSPKGEGVLSRSPEVVDTFVPLRAPKLHSLDRALADPTFESVDPASLPVPAEVLTALKRARKVLVVSHIPPDGDCVGSAVAIATALRALGKDAEACVDHHLTGTLRGLVAPGAVKTFDQLRHRDHDLVVLVDVGGTERIGRARLAIEAAPAVLVVDHHHVDPTAKTLGLRPDAQLTRWIDTDADAASMMAAAICGKLTRGVEVAAEDRAQMARGLCAGIHTDTDRFQLGGMDEKSLRVFKHLLHRDLGGALAPLERVLRYRLPEAARAVLAERPAVAGVLRRPEHAALATQVRMLAARGLGVRERVFEDGKYGVVWCPKEVFEVASKVARLEDPQSISMDVRESLQREQMRRMEARAQVTALLVEDPDRVMISTRSAKAGPAMRLARHLGGGGHPSAGGAHRREPVQVVVELIHRYFQDV